MLANRIVDRPAEERDGGRVVASHYWHGRWAGLKPRLYSGPPNWHPLVARYLPRNRDWTVFEVGCVPGRLLVYFHKEFGYRPAGIDYVDQLDMVSATLAANDVPAADLYLGDFFEYEPHRRYDVVASAGFIEHFENYMPAIRKHVELVRPGGFLVMSVPNLTHAQYYLHSIFDRGNLRAHRFEIMRPANMLNAVQSCGMEVLYAGPTITFDFWIVNRGTGVRRLITWFVEGMAGRLHQTLDRLKLGAYPNKWFSPHILCVARKPETNGESAHV